MIDAKERVGLVDFGIAKAIPTAEQEASTTETPITGGDAVVGTPAYMSPEQVMGWPLDARSDIYSFGIVLFELFTGQVPFHGSNRAATMRKHIEDPLPLHGPLAQLLPTPLVHVLERALAKDPDRRYADVAELIRDLERARDSLKTDTLDAVPDALPLRWLLPTVALVAGVAFFELTAPHPPEQGRPVPSTIPVPSKIPPPTATTTSTTTTTVPPTTMATAPTIVPTMMAAAPTSTLPSKPVEKRPECLSCPPPPYPPAAEKYGLVGTVELEVTIDETGNVTGTRVLRGHSAFRAVAERVVRGWRFVPATRDGVPVKYTLRQVVEFTQSSRR